MKKLICLAVLLAFVLLGTAYALLDDNSTNATADATAVQGQIGINKSVNVNKNKNIGINKQQQGQLQGQQQGQVAVGKVEVSDNSSSKTTAIAFPSTGATEGVASANASYMFGNLGLSDTEIYKKGGYIIQTVLAIPDEYLSKPAKAEIIATVINKMMKSVKPRRLLAIGPEQHSKNLLNLFGLISLDSFWADGQKPFQCKSDIK